MTTFSSQESNSLTWIKVRIILVGVFLIVVMFAVIVRVAALMYKKKNESMESLLRSTCGSLKIESQRGSILDRNGKKLAMSVKTASLYVNTSEIKNPDKSARRLSPILHLPLSKIKRVLDSKRSFAWVKRHVSGAEKDRIEHLKCKGLHFKTEYERVYPYKSLAGHVIGFVGIDGTGLEGVELAYDSFLRGKERSFPVFWDALRQPIARSLPDEEIAEGSDVQLTLDCRIQYFAEENLRMAIENFEADSGEVVVLDPRKGDILALAVYPFFNPNEFRHSSPDTWRNRAITDSFEPGSTFKLFLFAAAMDKGCLHPDDKIFCENGVIKISSHRIHDVHPHGWLTAAEVMKVSSNIGAVKIGESLGTASFYEYIKKFGFGRLTGIDLPGEVQGFVRSPEHWAKVDLAAASFGQGIAATPLQMASAVAAIANGGKWVTPHIIKRILAPDGNPSKACFHIIKKAVIKPSTARSLRDIMEGVVQEGGTGVRGAIAGYPVAGKTGTSQTYDQEECEYSNKKGTASFIGFVPSDDPQFVIGVFIHNPKTIHYGGVVAAPVFEKIGEESLMYVGIPPSIALAQKEGNAGGIYRKVSFK